MYTYICTVCLRVQNYYNFHHLHVGDRNVSVLCTGSPFIPTPLESCTLAGKFHVHAVYMYMYVLLSPPPPHLSLSLTYTHSLSLNLSVSLSLPSHLYVHVP